MAKKQHFQNQIIRGKVLDKFKRQGIESMRELEPSDLELKAGVTGGVAYHRRGVGYKAVPETRMRGGLKRLIGGMDAEGDGDGPPLRNSVPEPLKGGGTPKFVGGARRAKLLGKHYGNQMMELDDDFKQMVGSGFFGKFLEGLKDAGRAFVFPIKTLAKIGKDLPLPPQLKAVAGIGDMVLGGIDDPKYIRDLKGKAKRGRPKKIVEAVEPMEGSGKRTSPWILHVKSYAKKHNIPYNQALKQASASYKR